MTYTPQLPAGFSLIELQTVGSTNDHARLLAKSGYPAGTIVWTHEQTAGKGRQGNSWTSVPGNLYMSLILRPDIAAALTGQLSFMAAVALAETFRELLPITVQINLKWPNDVLLNDRKAAGILLESEINGDKPVEWVVIGIGVNIAGSPEGAISLAELGGKQRQAGEVLEILAARLKSLHDVWQKSGFEPVRTEWLGYSRNVGSTINVRLPKQTLTGTFTGLDAQGALQLLLPDGSQKSISSGEVFLG